MIFTGTGNTTLNDILVLHGEKDTGSSLEVLNSISIFDSPEKLLDHSDSRDPLRSIKSEILGNGLAIGIF